MPTSSSAPTELHRRAPNLRTPIRLKRFRDRLRSTKEHGGTDKPGLALLIRPARIGPAVPFVYLPLCQWPNAYSGNHRGNLARWYHGIPPRLMCRSIPDRFVWRVKVDRTIVRLTARRFSELEAATWALAAHAQRASAIRRTLSPLV
jgi:hypothetical protein